MKAPVKEASSGLLQKLSSALESIADNVVITDRNGRIEYVNPAFERTTGYSLAEVAGKTPRILKSGVQSDEFYGRLWKVILSGRVFRSEFTNKTKSGTLYIEEQTITPIFGNGGEITSFVATGRHVTSRKKLESQLLRTQRLESIGTLAGGVAHDLNNVLSPVMMAIEILRRKHTDPTDLKVLDSLDASVKRGAEIVKQVLTFARGAEGEKIVLDPRHVIREIESLVRETFPKLITFTPRLAKELHRVNGNATQLHQVLLNLCVNARDAMPSGGRIEVSAENAELDEVYERMHPEALPGPYVLITLSDNGTGIPPGELDKIFDPFFTTKPAGKGTGLGLSTTLGIIKSHGGFINVYSEVGKGTQFKIYLPAVTGGTVEAPGPERPEIPQGEGELILVVDDELSICEIARATLEAHGYRALVANDGTEAITRFVEHRDSIGLILIDIMMPYMDGPTTIRALQKLDPRVKIIATSGLSSNEELVRTTSGVRSFLVKPYTADKLLRAIRDVLHPAG